MLVDGGAHQVGLVSLEDELRVEGPAREGEELLDAAGLLPVHQAFRGRRQVERSHDVSGV